MPFQFEPGVARSLRSGCVPPEADRLPHPRRRCARMREAGRLHRAANARFASIPPPEPRSVASTRAHLPEHHDDSFRMARDTRRISRRPPITVDRQTVLRHEAAATPDDGRRKVQAYQSCPPELAAPTHIRGLMMLRYC